jgi:hypothetical protein
MLCFKLLYFSGVPFSNTLQLCRMVRNGFGQFILGCIEAHYEGTEGEGKLRYLLKGIA